MVAHDGVVAPLTIHRWFERLGELHRRIGHRFSRSEARERVKRYLLGLLGNSTVSLASKALPKAPHAFTPCGSTPDLHPKTEETSCWSPSRPSARYWTTKEISSACSDPHNPRRDLWALSASWQKALELFLPRGLLHGEPARATLVLDEGAA